MRLFWTGTDSLSMNDLSIYIKRKWPYIIMFRCLMWFLDRYVVGAHFVMDEKVKGELMKFGMKKPIYFAMTPINYPVKFDKVPHKGFNVLLYRPKKYTGWKKTATWVYSFDLTDRLMADFPNVNWIIVDGNERMEFIYPFIDLFLRPNRFDSMSRMVRECKIQKIPYYWSRENPDYDEMKKVLLDEMEKTYKAQSLLRQK